MSPSFSEALASCSGKPASHYRQPFTAQLEALDRETTLRNPLERTSDWIEQNRQRFAVVQGETPHAPNYELISAPADGTDVGIILVSDHNHTLRDTFLIFTRPFDQELAVTTGLLPRHLRATLKAGNYLRAEKGRNTCSIPEGLKAMVPSSSGSSARRAVGVVSRILADYPPLKPLPPSFAN